MEFLPKLETLDDYPEDESVVLAAGWNIDVFPWEESSDQQQQAIRMLGCSTKSWEAEGKQDLPEVPGAVRWDNLAPERRALLASLHVTLELWDLVWLEGPEHRWMTDPLAHLEWSLSRTIT